MSILKRSSASGSDEGPETFDWQSPIVDLMKQLAAAGGKVPESLRH